MKYYLYVSDGKIDMLWPQKPRGALRRMSASLKLDFRVLGFSLEKKPNDDETLYSKLASVEEHILENFEVGTIENPKSYFTGTLLMYMGILKLRRRKKEFAYFGGKLPDRHIALVGSTKHLVGSSKAFSDVQLSSDSFGLYLNPLSLLREFVSEREQPEGDHDASPLIIMAANRSIKAPPQRVEFLAKRLHEGKSSLVGTPLYVALAD